MRSKKANTCLNIRCNKKDLENWKRIAKNIYGEDRMLSKWVVARLNKGIGETKLNSSLGEKNCINL